MKLTVIGCSPAWPNPGGTQSGYLVEGSGSVLLDCGPGVLSRLRLGGGWPEPGAIALTHFHLDHCGDLIPWVWGAFYERDATDRRRRPDLWVPPGGRDRLASIGTEFGFREMFEQVFSIEEYEPGRPFLAGGQSVTALPVLHYRMDAYGFRVSDGGTTIAYSGDSGPGDHLPSLPATPISSSARRRSPRAPTRARCAGTSRSTRRRRPSRRRRRGA